MIAFLKNRLRFTYRKLRLYTYWRNIQAKVRLLRSKDKIKVLFVISDLSMWKTESLYSEMLKHSRFEPILGLSLLTCDKPKEAIKKYNLLKEYLEANHYDYLDIFANDIQEIEPDIIFYQQPYDGYIDWYMSYRNQFNKSLICHINYGFSTMDVQWLKDVPFYRYCWQIFYENSTAKNAYSKHLPKFVHNGVVTGIPFQDILSQDKNKFTNPWKNQTACRKRIIWAPHHSISVNSNLLEYSTFLEVADIMIDIAKKYKDYVQFAFKPHPFLIKRLYNHWGVEKTDAYYRQWNEMENTQLELGDYIGLFKHSDAMIHDCSSFTIEYLYVNSPVMYLVNGEPHTDTLNEYGKAAYNTHVFGSTKEDIDTFIAQVINGVDVKADDRKLFKEKYLSTPNEKKSSENIINAILGSE